MSPPRVAKARRPVRARAASPRGPGEPLVGGVAPVRVGDAGVRLEQAVVLVAEPPLRPAAHDLGGVEVLERDALGRHARDVVGQRDRRVARRDVEAAGLRDDLDAGLGLDLGPGRVGALGQADVVGPVVRQADDPAVVLARAAVVAELELLEPEDPVAEPSAQPVRGPAADPTQPDDDGIPLAVGCHVRLGAASVIIKSGLRGSVVSMPSWRSVV